MNPILDYMITILLVGLIFFGFIYCHEITHGQISGYYGCQNITIGFGNFSRGNFMHTSQDCDFSPELAGSWLQSQSLNDIIFVGITIPLTLIIALMLGKHE